MLAFAAGYALAAGVFGNRTAWPLLASLAFCLIAPKYIRPLETWELFAVDLMVFAAIVRPNMTLADKLILALFFVAWPLYLTPFYYWGGWGVVVVQLLLTVPLLREQTIPPAVSHGPKWGMPRRQAHEGGA